jgi:hypothetical protein
MPRGALAHARSPRSCIKTQAFRVLAAGNFPAHRTIRDFRAQHLAEFTELFTRVVRLARKMGLVKLGNSTLNLRRMGSMQAG